MNEYKAWWMKKLNRYCGNCRYCHITKCMKPVKRLYTFEGVKEEPLDRDCRNIIASKDCKWKRKKNDD